MKKLVLVLFLAFSVTALFAGEPGHACKMKDKGGKAAEAKVVEMDGKLLCKHCNLHLQEKCEKVFQPSSDEAKLYPICQSSKGDLEAMSEEGTAIVHVKGKIVTCAEDGKEELLIEEITKAKA